MLILLTKCPSITSTWSQSAPNSSILLESAARVAKSALRIEGQIMGVSLLQLDIFLNFLFSLATNNELQQGGPVFFLLGVARFDSPGLSLY